MSTYCTATSGAFLNHSGLGNANDGYVRQGKTGPWMITVSQFVSLRP